MTPTSRRKQKKRSTFVAIVDAASASFNDIGYEATAMEEIARSCGISVGTVYNYFGTKNAILAAIVLPIAGLATVAWRDRQDVVREDVRVFLRVRGRAQSRARLNELRGRLVSDFDELAEAWRAAGEP